MKFEVRSTPAAKDTGLRAGDSSASSDATAPVSTIVATHETSPLVVLGFRSTAPTANLDTANVGHVASLGTEGASLA